LIGRFMKRWAVWTAVAGGALILLAGLAGGATYLVKRWKEGKGGAGAALAAEEERGPLREGRCRFRRRRRAECRSSDRRGLGRTGIRRRA